jgi:mono/diheme cytochrome c family protein
MKKLSVITVIALSVALWGCSEIQRKPSRVYMPDMAYSRAYETYASTANLDSLGIHYDKRPVAGTIKRGELFPFPLAKDKAGDTTNYILAKQVQNPLHPLDTVKMIEAERLYLVNCGICHGMKLDGNGPLYNGGNGPYAAAPRNLVGDQYAINMPDGQMFYSISYGKGQMGPYGPQLSTTQRWMVVHYIKSKQAAAKAPAPAAGASAKAGSDSTGTKGGSKDSTATAVAKTSAGKAKKLL